MRNIIIVFLAILSTLLLIGDLYYSISFVVTGFFLVEIVFNSTKKFAFREWSIFLYSFNYLFSPALIYLTDSKLLVNQMKINPSHYFSMAVPGMFCFFIGMRVFKTRIFVINDSKFRTDVIKNESLLLRFVIFGFLIRLTSGFLPPEIDFIIYLLSSLRFVGVFALFKLDSKKYSILLWLVMLFEFYVSAIAAMYHDAVMWLLFFALFYIYTKKPSIKLRLIGLGIIIFMVFFIQGLKGLQRGKFVETGNSDLTTFFETSADVSSDFTSSDNIVETLNRANQAWIFASTVEKMDRDKDFQGLNILGIYLEAALLPRFLAPNKIKSGDKDIFNKFSGHTISGGTSMGLGVFADGYIAYGYFGVMLFTFGLGLLFNSIFLVVEFWSKQSEFYILMVMPILVYAVRPDCELQTVINHIAKSLFLFHLVFVLTKYRFQFNSISKSRVLN